MHRIILGQLTSLDGLQEVILYLEVKSQKVLSYGLGILISRTNFGESPVKEMFNKIDYKNVKELNINN